MSSANDREKIEQLKDGDAAPKTGEHAKKAGVIGDQKNQETHGKAFQKTHERDKRPSELELPAVESFGIKGDVQPGDTGKGRGGGKEPLRVRDDSWRPEAGALRWQAFGEGVQALVGSDHEKAVLARRHFLKVLNDHEQDDSVKENMTKALQQFEGRFQNSISRSPYILKSTRPRRVRQICIWETKEALPASSFRLVP